MILEIEKTKTRDELDGHHNAPESGGTPIGGQDGRTDERTKCEGSAAERQDSSNLKRELSYVISDPCMHSTNLKKRKKLTKVLCITYTHSLHFMHITNN